MRGGDLRIAAVVARAGEHQNILLLERKARRQLGGGGSGALHEGWHRLARFAFEAADVVR